MEDTGLRHRQAGGGDSKSKTAVSSPKGSSGIATTVDEKFNALLSWDSLPAWRQDNAFIHSGYRRIHPSYWHQVLSLAHLHNESVNIWSHLLGGAGAVAASVYAYTIVRPRYESANSADVLAIGSFFTGAVLCLGMSATFHALLSHSENVARWGNKLDYSGIVALIVGSYMPALYYGFFCKPFLMRSYMALIWTLGIGCGVVSWVDKFRTPDWRPYRATMFIGLGLSGVIPVIHCVSIYGYSVVMDRMAVNWIILHGVMYIFGAVLYAVRWPERSWPGTFDIWGSSHQIFHIFVVMAGATHLYAMSRAFDFHHTVMASQCLLE